MSINIECQNDEAHLEEQSLATELDRPVSCVQRWGACGLSHASTSAGELDCITLLLFVRHWINLPSGSIQRVFMA